MFDAKEVWDQLTHSQQLAATAYVFRQITWGPQSFRHLIYDQLGFGPDAYALLLGEGGMAITNTMHDAYNTEKE